MEYFWPYLKGHSVMPKRWISMWRKKNALDLNLSVLVNFCIFMGTRQYQVPIASICAVLQINRSFPWSPQQQGDQKYLLTCSATGEQGNRLSDQSGSQMLGHEAPTPTQSCFLIGQKAIPLLTWGTAVQRGSFPNPLLLWSKELPMTSKTGIRACWPVWEVFNTGIVIGELLVLTLSYFIQKCRLYLCLRPVQTKAKCSQTFVLIVAVEGGLGSIVILKKANRTNL